MTLSNFDALCAPSAEVLGDSLGDQVASLEQLQQSKIDGDAFFRRSHFTDGLRRLVTTGFERLTGKSDTGAYYLTQAMGGGKTHALIAFGLLAADPGLRRRIVPEIADGNEFGAAKVVMFSGHQQPRNLLWGSIAESLGRPETMERFWSGGPLTPGIDDWVAAIGKDEPVLILLDELPSYLQMAQGQPVGNTTLGELTIGALERLFNALTQLPRACVVVTNLKDDVYLDGSNQLRTLIESLTKHYDRNATAITPVQQNTGEIYEIIRKRLFDSLPDASRIEEVGQAYVAALEAAKRVDTIPVTPEVFLARIRDSYPFHPSIRDIVGRFAENRGYQKTRALIRLLRHAIRGALKAPEQVFLVGLQHLDLSDQATLEEIRKINPSFTNAIAKDISDRGNALAEKIDGVDGSNLATAIAKTLLMSSLSSAEAPVRGLREGELYEALVDPLVKVSNLKPALEKLQGQAWYLQRDIEQRIYVSQTANVTAEINEIAENIADEHVDEMLRKKLSEVFKPRAGDLYDADMAILPAIDQITVSDDRVRLVILEHAADALPADFEAWWQSQERQNAVLLLTVDPNAVKSMRGLARRMRAIEAVTKTIAQREGQASQQMVEVERIRDKDANGFSSAVREGFKTIIYPVSQGKLRAYGDFRMEFNSNDYSGEEQIRKTLTERGKFIPADKFDAQFENLRQDAEEMLFDADSVQFASLRRNAALRPGWFWLPRNGLDTLVRMAVQRGYWRERDGMVQRRFEVVSSVQVRIDEYAPSPLDTGRYTLTVSRQDADTVYFSEKGPPDPRSSATISGTTYETEAPAVWFLASDSSGKSKLGDPVEWRAPVRIKPAMESTGAGHRLTVLVVPRAAIARASFDGSDPQHAVPFTGQVMVPDGTAMVRVVAEFEGLFSAVESIPLGVQPADAPTGSKPKVALDDNKPVTLTTPWASPSSPAAFSALTVLRDTAEATVLGGSFEVANKGVEGEFLALRVGTPVRAADLDSLAKLLTDMSGFAEPAATLRLGKLQFATGRDFRSFADKLGLDFERQTWSQDS